MNVIALMMIGSAPEPLLPACLESLRGAVDKLIINDNSGIPNNANVMNVRRSDWYKNGKVHIVEAPFVNFAHNRNLLLNELRQRALAPDWILNLDADHVHTPAFSVLTRELLPLVPQHYSMVDAYVFEVMRSPRYFQSMDHRHRFLIRYTPSIRWEGAVHEFLLNTAGPAFVLPYVFVHYGSMRPPEELAKKWSLYGSLGDAESGSHLIDVQNFIRSDANHVVRFLWPHPVVAQEALKEFSSTHKDFLTQFESWVEYRSLMTFRSAWINVFYQLKLFWLLLTAIVRFRSASPSLFMKLRSLYEK